MDAKLTAVVVDRDAFARRAVRDALEADGIAVVDTAATDDEAVAQCQAHEPDVVVADISSTASADPQLIRRLHIASPRAAIMALAREDDAEEAFQVLRAGATGYLPKRISADVLPRIVRAVARGEAVLSRAVTTQLVERLRTMPADGRGLRPVHSPLSSREWEVLDLLREDCSTREIALALTMAPETVRSHVKHILGKLGAHSREEAVERAEHALRTQTDELLDSGPNAT